MPAMPGRAPATLALRCSPCGPGTPYRPRFRLAYEPPQKGDAAHECAASQCYPERKRAA